MNSLLLCVLALSISRRAKPHKGDKNPKLSVTKREGKKRIFQAESFTDPAMFCLFLMYDLYYGKLGSVNIQRLPHTDLPDNGV